jgi:hypothetical protein
LRIEPAVAADFATVDEEKVRQHNIMFVRVILKNDVAGTSANYSKKDVARLTSVYTKTLVRN